MLLLVNENALGFVGYTFDDALSLSESAFGSLCSTVSFHQTVLLIGHLGHALYDTAPNNAIFWRVAPSNFVGISRRKELLASTDFANMFQFHATPPGLLFMSARETTA